MAKDKSYRTDWDTIPHTDANAKPVDWESAPKSRYVALVRKATIRNATIRNERFLLVEDFEVQQRTDGTERLEVECLWYGRRPKVTWMNITVQPDDYKIQPSDGASVVTNIARHNQDRG